MPSPASMILGETARGELPFSVPDVTSPFEGPEGESEGWSDGAFDGDYCAFDPYLLTLNDSLFNELLLTAHAFRIRPAEIDVGDKPPAQGASYTDSAASGGARREDGAESVSADDGLAVAAAEVPSMADFVETSADAFGLDRPCLVCRVLDAYRREYGFSAQWMADYAFLCTKCLASPPCATVTFVTAYEFVYVMDKHFLKSHGASLVSAFGRRVLTHEDVQRHFFLHGCYRTDGGVPGRKPDDVVLARPRPGRPLGGRAGPPTLGSAKVLYSNYSFLAQTATRAMMSTLADYDASSSANGPGELAPLPAKSGAGGSGARSEKRRRTSAGVSFSSSSSSSSPGFTTALGDTAYNPHHPATATSTTTNDPPGATKGRYSTAVLAPSAAAARTCPTALAVAMAGWKECAKGVECFPAPGRRGDSCMARAVRDDEDYELELEREEERAAAEAEAYGSLFPNRRADRPASSHGPGKAASKDRLREFERTRSYGDLTLLLLAGTAAVPAGGGDGGRTDEFMAMAARIRKETVESYWAATRCSFGSGAVIRFARFYEEDAEPHLELGPVMLTHLKHAQSRGGTSAECLPCNLMIVKEYWLALRRLKREVIAYSANNVSLFHSVEPVLNEWDDENRLGMDDGRCFINLLKGAGPEAVYKHMFCDPMCAARSAQTSPRALFEHPPPSDAEELSLHKARLASNNRFEGRVCAGIWALAYAFKSYQVFPPRPTALAAFVKDAGSMLHRHSMSLISLEHTLGAYV